MNPNQGVEEKTRGIKTPAPLKVATWRSRAGTGPRMERVIGQKLLAPTSRQFA